MFRWSLASWSDKLAARCAVAAGYRSRAPIVVRREAILAIENAILNFAQYGHALPHSNFFPFLFNLYFSMFFFLLFFKLNPIVVNGWSFCFWFDFNSLLFSYIQWLTLTSIWPNIQIKLSVERLLMCVVREQKTNTKREKKNLKFKKSHGVFSKFNCSLQKTPR